jgi:hypothetical protein
MSLSIHKGLVPLNMIEDSFKKHFGVLQRGLIFAKTNSLFEDAGMHSLILCVILNSFGETESGSAEEQPAKG